MDKIKQKIALELKEKDDNKKRKKAVRKEKKASKKEAKKLKKEAKRRGAENSSNSSSCSESEKDDMNDKAERREEQKCADRMIRSRSRDNSRDRDRRSGGVVDNQEGAPNSRQADTKGRSRLDRRSESRDGNRAFRTRDRSDRGAASDRYSRSHYADRDTRPRRDSRDRQDDRGGHMRESGREQQHRQQRRSPSPGIRGRHSDHHAADDDDRKRPRSPVRDEHADKKPRGDRQHDDGSQSDSSSRGGSRPIKRYGLLPGRNGGSSSSQTSSDSTSLGPNQELLNRKLEAERQAEVARRNRTRIDVKAMSEEERLRKIQEMQMDADHNDMLRTTRHQLSSGASSGDVEGHSGNAVFLESMRKSVYTTGEIDMRSRIDQNKHSRQSSADIDSAEGFIRK